MESAGKELEALQQRTSSFDNASLAGPTRLGSSDCDTPQQGQLHVWRPGFRPTPTPLIPHLGACAAGKSSCCLCLGNHAEHIRFLTPWSSPSQTREAQVSAKHFSEQHLVVVTKGGRDASYTGQRGECACHRTLSPAALADLPRRLGAMPLAHSEHSGASRAPPGPVAARQSRKPPPCLSILRWALLQRTGAAEWLREQARKQERPQFASLSSSPFPPPPQKRRKSAIGAHYRTAACMTAR